MTTGTSATPSIHPSSPCDALRQDRGDALGWVLFFLWAGLVLLAEPVGFAARFAGWDGWSVFFAGVAVLCLGGGLLRLAVGQREKGVLSVVIGAVLAAVVLGSPAFWAWALPAACIGLAIVALRGVFGESRGYC